MFNKFFLPVFITLILSGSIIAQKSQTGFIQTPFKIQFNGDALIGVRADGKANTYGLPSVKNFLSRYKNEKRTDASAISVTFVNTGCKTIYDLCSNGIPVEIWQDPSTPDNIHAVFMTAPLGDGTSFPNRRSKYYFSDDKGTTWYYLTDVPTGIKSGFPSINGFSDGTALIGNHSTDGGGIQRSQAYKDAFAGVGSFTRLDAPGNTGYEWPKVLTTNSVSLTNKFLIMASSNGQDTTKYNICTNVNSTPGTWLGWNSFPAQQSECYCTARGSDGRIGIAFVNDDEIMPASYGDVWFMESTNNGTTFSTPLKIFDANFGASGDSLGGLRGISMTYAGNIPCVVFETVKQTTDDSFFPAAPSKIRFWASNLTGSDPNKSIVIADTTMVGYHPYIGVNDVMASICRPSIGSSFDGTMLYVAFTAASGVFGGTDDTTSFMDIWFTYSSTLGTTWHLPVKLNPASPVKDWRYPSISPASDYSSSFYYCNLIALKGSIPGSYVNGSGNGESAEEFWFMRIGVNGSPQGPPPPTLISPANGATGVPLTPLFDWTDVSGATTYNFQIANNASFTTPILSLTNLSNSGYQMSLALQPNTLYYWRVSSTNGVGTGLWSGAWSFTALGGPAAPTLISPANGANILTTTPTLDWNDVSGAVSYEVQVATDSGFVNMILNSGTTASQYSVPSGTLAGNLTYFWRARAENGSGTGPWSAVWKFRIVTLPTAPTLVYPLNYSTNQSPTPTLDWDSLASASTYRIQIGADSLFSSIIYDTAGVSRSYLNVRPGILQPNMRYFWRVNAANIAGTGPWSVVWNFRVSPNGIYQTNSELPKEFRLYDNYPNPFNPVTTIKFAVPRESFVRITVYDISGR
ncbi:MAG: hypothetical protein LWX07_03390, partial [Bacteroidetes bacterium]|nr:hypothetical protein [Bacteroidota bacterium]